MNWIKFGIAFAIVGIVPIWIIPLVKAKISYKILVTLVMGAITYWAVAKRENQ